MNLQRKSPYVMDFEAYAPEGGTFIDDDLNSDKNGVETSTNIPPEFLFYVIPYMNLQGTLTMECVCKYLRQWVRNDILLWRKLHVEPPLSKKLTNFDLIKLFKRTKGQLESLILVDCMMITEDIIGHIIVSSPMLYKICLPNCMRVNAGSIVQMVNERNDRGMAPLKEMKLHNIYGLETEHLESLLSMMSYLHTTIKPRYYHQPHEVYSSDGRAIDVEVCPKCSNVRLVYDCTRERCRQKQECRGCILCVLRCVECGICMEEDECEETLCHDNVCLKCWLKLSKCGECNRPECSRHANWMSDIVFVCDECSNSSWDETRVMFDL